MCLFCDQEAEQARLELEMKRRRERIEKWRAERKVKEVEQTKKDLEKGVLLGNSTMLSCSSYVLLSCDLAVNVLSLPSSLSSLCNYSPSL